VWYDFAGADGRSLIFGEVVEVWLYFVMNEHESESSRVSSCVD
jgi:hypothetical protein